MSQQLNDIFEKDVNRPIEGVIKADDETGLQIEVEEYVITSEVAQRLDEFLEAYTNYKNANGVWISGFFGSGKSHLLKMLSHLLESGRNDNNFILESFLSKTEDRLLRAKLEKAIRIPSKSVLFNIDQKADVVDKADFDALLGVFIKVFDEMQGYFGRQGEVAQFERELDGRGLYDDFKRIFEDIADIPWLEGREQALLEESNIARAYAQVMDVNEEDGMGIIDRYADRYRMSIEDFAKLVHAYIKKQEAGFRLNFFVDEVGQYVADNVKLMTNLQTIAESLNTICDGQAWIIVTAQEDMNTVVGEMGKQQSNDFSKIQARFANRMKLTSANVRQVIEKRLLLKNDKSVGILEQTYQEQSNNFKTLFDFADGAKTYRNFQSQDDFVNSYPFIPYQFDLFQQAIQSLSEHSAFEGRHSSVGERSMLGVFQQVLKSNIGDKSVGQLATFDFMYDGIANSLKTAARHSILLAEKNLDDDFIVRVLKVLFLVKYVNGFNATVRNISVLMTERFNQDIADLRDNVEEALNELETQTYIERNGNVYAYLTNEEKDIEQEIKNVDVENQKVIQQFGSIIFDQILAETKIRPENGSHNYSFSPLLDGNPFKRVQGELAIHIMTPLYEHGENITIVQSQSAGTKELRIVLPPNARLVQDIRAYLRTEKYYRHNMASAEGEKSRILSTKQIQNNEREKAIRKQIEADLLKATYIVEQTILELSGSDAQSMMIKGFQVLIKRIYNRLQMLDGGDYTEKQIIGFIKKDDPMFGSDVVEMTEAERAVESYITLQQNQGQRVSVDELVKHFENAPYGWYLNAIQCMVAKLYARGKIEIRLDSNALEGDVLANALTNTRQHTNLLILLEKEYTTPQIRKLKDFYEEFFSKPASTTEAKELGKLTKEAFQKELLEIQSLLRDINDYPFLEALVEIEQEIKTLIVKPYNWFLTEFNDQDAFLDAKEDTITLIKSFMNGQHKHIYNDARIFLRVQQDNFSFVGFEESQELRAILDDKTCFRGNAMRDAKALMDELQSQINQALERAKQQAISNLQELQSDLEATDEFAQLTPEQQSDLRLPFANSAGVIQEQTSMAMVEAAENNFRKHDRREIVAQMGQWLAPAEPMGNTDTETRSIEPEYIPLDGLRPKFNKPWLADEADIDDYLTQLKDSYLQAIRAGKRIQL